MQSRSLEQNSMMKHDLHYYCKELGSDHGLIIWSSNQRRKISTAPGNTQQNHCRAVDINDLLKFFVVALIL